jgi:DNA-binding PadR family transcriptional regulator
MPARKSNRISPEYTLLGFLYHGSSHGYDLHNRLYTEFGHSWHVSQSQIYNILKRLEAQGAISSEWEVQEKSPPRQLMQLTEKGRQRFHLWLETPTPCSVHSIRIEFLSRLYFIHQFFPERTVETIHTQKDEVQAGLTRLEAAQAVLPVGQVFNWLALDLRTRQLKSILLWLDGCEQMLLKSSGDGGSYP